MKFAVSAAIAAISVQAWDQSYGYASQPYESYSAPRYDQEDIVPTYGYLGEEKPYYGLYRAPRRTRPLIANDGYRVKQRTDPYERLSKTVNAKCVLEDPEEESEVRGVIYLSQGATDSTTNLWGEIWGISNASLTINALGDLTEGCASAGGVFNPNVSRSGYGKIKGPAPGQLEDLQGSY